MKKTSPVLLSAGLFAATFALYLGTLAPSFTVGDAGELCAASVILGLAHSPGYPLYLLLGKAATMLVPFGSYAFRLNILSALTGALAVVVLFAALRKVLGAVAVPGHGEESPATGGPAPDYLLALAALACAVTPAFWRSSVQAEVFSLNALFSAGVMYAVASGRPLLASFLFGLGLGNHHTLVLLGPVVAYGILAARPVRARSFIAAALVFALGFSVYLYLPVRSVKNPALDWGNPENLRNIGRVISRADYGSLSLTVGKKLPRDAATTLRQLGRFTRDIRGQFTAVGLLVGLAGIVLAVRRRDRLPTLALAGWLILGPGFILLANLPFTAETDGILERFYVAVNLLWAFPLAAGLIFLGRHIGTKAAAVTAALAIAFLAAARLPAVSWRGYYLAHDYGRNILRTLPPDSVLFMDGGDDTFYSSAYLCFAEGRRPDVELHDRGGLVFRNVYGLDFRKLAREEKDARRAQVERECLATGRPVYYSTFNREVLPGIAVEADGFFYRPASAGDRNAWPAYSLRGVFGDGSEYSDYRSRALVPLYPYFAAFYNGAGSDYWEYAVLRWPEALWLANNVRIELANEAYRAFAAGRLTEARERYERLLRIDPRDRAALTNLGVIEEKEGRLAAAKERYRRSIELDPSYTEAYYNLSVIYWREGNWKEVVGTLERLLAVDPRDARALRYLPAARAKLTE